MLAAMVPTRVPVFCAAPVLRASVRSGSAKVIVPGLPGFPALTPHTFGRRASGGFTFQFQPTNKGFGIRTRNHDRLLVRLIDVKPAIESPVARGARLGFAIFNGAIAPLGRGQR